MGLTDALARGAPCRNPSDRPSPTPARNRHTSQRKRRGLTNVDVTLADVNVFDTSERFDRVISVEMFEHVRNHERLLQRIAGWLKPGGMLFVHMFCHRQLAYLFEDRGASDWITRHFFIGGMMPSEDWLTLFQRDLRLVERWWLNGVHYSKTCEAWLENMKRHEREARRLFAATYGVGEAQRWWVYWRLFFIACAELFRYRGGEEWGVAHYRFTKN